MTRHHRVGEVAAGEHTTVLSLAVRLVDVVTGDRPLGSPSVGVVVPGSGLLQPTAVNDSGYWLFLDADLPPDPLDLAIGGGDHYADDRIEVSRPVGAAPAVRVELAPAPQYSFGRGATLVRGAVVDAAGNGVGDAVVTVQGLDRRTRTNGNGEFVLFLGDQAVDEDPVTGDRWIVVDDADPVVEVDHDLGDRSASVTVPAGVVTHHTVTYP